MELHEKANQGIINKFSIFCSANTLMPYKYKKLVFDAAVTSALLYSAETWMTNNYKTIERQYNQLIRCLLGVRANTSISLCMIECGIPPVRGLIASRRCKFLKGKLQAPDVEQPFHFVHGLCGRYNTPSSKFIREALNYTEVDSISALVENMQERVGSTKIVTYTSVLNAQMTVHPVYSTNDYIPDYQRVAFTRLRLMSHNLRVETGRWSRTPRESRICDCDPNQIQTESHVLLNCPLTQGYRDDHCMLSFDSMETLMNTDQVCKELCKYVYTVLQHFS